MTEHASALMTIDRYSLLPAAVKQSRRHQRVSARWSLAISLAIGILIASTAAAYRRHQVSQRMHQNLTRATVPAWDAKQRTLQRMQQADQLEAQLGNADRYRPHGELIQTMGAIGASYESVPESGCIAVDIDHDQSTFRIHVLGPAHLSSRVERSLAAVDRIQSVSPAQLPPQSERSTDTKAKPITMIFEGTLIHHGGVPQ